MVCVAWFNLFPLVSHIGRQRYLSKPIGRSQKESPASLRTGLELVSGKAKMCLGLSGPDCDFPTVLSPTVGIYTVISMEAAVPLLQKIDLLAFPILIAVVLHELAHGYVAYRLGDPTAAHAGRLTLNPIAHVDPFGTVILPAILLFSGSPFLFGYAKPVPVNFANLYQPRRDMVLVALAGPLVNLLLAAFAALLLKFLIAPVFLKSGISANSAMMILQLVHACLLINVSLAVFNMLPVPPLDGGRVATGLLPRTPALALARLEPYGMLIILLLMTSGVLDDILRPMQAFLIDTLL